MNGDLQTRIQTDTDGDGLLDLNYLLVFDPLDQFGPGGSFGFVAGGCVAPMASTSCWAYSSIATSYANMPATCLGVLAGTTSSYTPGVTPTAPPCFLAPLGDVTLSLNGFSIFMSNTYIAATYAGTPATSLVNGLIRGFISESDADNTILASSMPLVGGQALSALLPGGTGCCASHSDKDISDGVSGWWVYFAFTASEVPLTDPPTRVGALSRPSLTLEAPYPNPFNPATEIRYLLPARSRVQLTIFDASGREVRELAGDTQTEGPHTARWDGRDTHGWVASSGVYFVRLNANGESRTRKLVLLK
ncbi:MAG TPA: T9SS type A sorting domain-containing protein [Candidatus Krumholzibacteria bacterium]|nr:T9SS type A sorting domain-containing protein [Candidatus Krumholzibacteria bacterium]